MKLPQMTLPLHVERREWERNDQLPLVYWVVIDAEGNEISDWLNESDARYIVRAVNREAKLRAFAERYKRWLEMPHGCSYCWFPPGDHADTCVVKEIDAALAEGEDDA